MGRVRALARYSLGCTLRTPYAWVAAVLLVALTLLGLYSSARAGLGWRLSTSFLTQGAFLAAVIGLRSGLIDQRMAGTRTFLRMNLMTPVEHTAGLTLSLLGAWLLLCAAMLGLALTLPGGGLETAAWETWLFALRTLPLLPLVLVMERVSDIQLPFFGPALLWLALLLLLIPLLGEVRAVALMNPPVAELDWGSTLPRVLRAALGPVGFALILAVTKVRSGRRREVPPGRIDGLM